MTDKASKQFTDGFFDTFNWELDRIHGMVNAEVLRYMYGEIDKEAFMSMLNEHHIRISLFRSYLDEIFRFAKLEAKDHEEYKDALEKWQKVDRMIFKIKANFRNDIEWMELLQTDSQSRE